MTAAKKHDGQKAATVEDTAHALRVAEARIQVLYRALIEMKGGADTNLERAFAAAEDSVT